MGRVKSLEAVAECFLQRVKPIFGVQGDLRQLNPICATCGAPGTGKSQLLDYIASNLGEHVTEHYKEHPDFIKAVKSAIPLLITYNGWSCTSQEEDVNLKAYFALRILATFGFFPVLQFTFFRYFFPFTSGNTWEHFAKWAAASPKFSVLTARDAIKVVLKHSGAKSVFLGVDELLKVDTSPMHSNVHIILTIVGALLDTFRPHKPGDDNSVLFCVVTSLDALQLSSSQTRSGRL